MADNKKVLNGDENIWVVFKTSGYPFRLSRQLKEATRENEILDTILPYIIACKLPRVDGTLLESETLSNKELLDEVDEQIVVAIIRAFYEFRQERMYQPVSPN